MVAGTRALEAGALTMDLPALLSDHVPTARVAPRRRDKALSVPNTFTSPPTQEAATELTPDQEQFAYWLSLPTNQRKPQLQQDYAKQHGITRVSTLSNWKRLPQFQLAVKAHRRELADELTGEALHAWRRAIRRGHWDAVKCALIHGGVIEPDQRAAVATVNVGLPTPLVSPDEARRLLELAERAVAAEALAPPTFARGGDTSTLPCPE